MSDTALYANNAKQQGNNAALGEPNVLISHDRVVVISKQAVSMLQRFLESLASGAADAPVDRDIGEDVELRGPVSGRLLEGERDATYPQRLTTVRGVHRHRLFVEPAPAGEALAYGAAEELALHLAGLTDDERRATPRHPKHQSPRTK